MKIPRRSRRGLPSILEVSFYLLVVVAFCVINWKLLKTVENTEKPEAKPFEEMLVRAMLEEMPPVMKYEPPAPVTNALYIGTSSEHRLELETWMIRLQDFNLSEVESELALEDWMINTDSWRAD